MKRLVSKSDIRKALEREAFAARGTLTFSCLSIELSLSPGEIAEGSFTISSQDAEMIGGVILSDNIRMKCVPETFRTSPVEIRWQFDGTGLDVDDQTGGAFRALTDLGEYSLPYHVKIHKKTYESSLGEIRNLFHFANLARTSWQEAVKLFYMPDFARILSGNDRQYLSVYRGLRTKKGSEQRMEEFLLQIHKKQRVEYLTDRDAIAVVLKEGISKETIRITRSGWGYTCLWVELDGDFLSAEKQRLTDDDFLGNRCEFVLEIRHDMLHRGRNYGRVRFYNEYTSIEIPVRAGAGSGTPGRGRRDRRRVRADFADLYVEYGLGRISESRWVREMELLLERAGGRRKKEPVQGLLQAHLLLLKRRQKEAARLLEQSGRLLAPSETRAEIWCYYLYLTTLCDTDYSRVKNALEDVRRIYSGDQTNWMIGWLLLYMDREYSGHAYRKWLFLEQQFEKGCHSPVWYMEAAALLRGNPALLMKPSPFVIQTLNFMVKRDCMTAEVIEQIHQLADRMKGYSERMYGILKACYEKSPDLDTLRAICALLIKGGRTAPEYAGWYRLGIERELWLTRLYEYYMLSVDLRSEEKIPEAALRYFTFDSDLPYDRSAYLYAYVVKHREEHPELYRAYLPNIARFLSEQLEKGRMNRDLACLYQRMIHEGMISEENASRYADALFVHEFAIKEPDAVRMILIHGRLKNEISLTIHRGRVYAPIYSRDVCLMLEGASGGRFAWQTDYRDKALFYPEDTLARMGDLREMSTGVLLYAYEQDRPYTMVNEENVRFAQELVTRENISEEFRKELGLRLLQYFREHDMPDAMQRLFLNLRPERMNCGERAEVISGLVLRGVYDVAFDWIGKYGLEKLHARVLVRLCSHRIVRDDFQADDLLILLTFYSFQKGKYDENMLSYLQRHFRGSIRHLQMIWSACRRFDVDCYELCERMIIQMLYTREFCAEEVEIFKTYLSGCADRAVTDEYLKRLSARYFVAEEPMEEFVLRELLRRAKNRENTHDMEKLALLRHFSLKEALTEEEELLIAGLLDEMGQKAVTLGFFKKFASFYPRLENLFDKVFLEYKSDSGRPVVLHYMRKGETGAGKSEYHTEELQPVAPGVYTKAFPLFFGERLDYYITEKLEGKEKLTVDGSLRPEETGPDHEGSRFARINQISRALSGKDCAEAGELLEDFWRQEKFAEKIFTLL